MHWLTKNLCFCQYFMSKGKWSFSWRIERWARYVGKCFTKRAYSQVQLNYFCGFTIGRAYNKVFTVCQNFWHEFLFDDAVILFLDKILPKHEKNCPAIFYLGNNHHLPSFCNENFIMQMAYGRVIQWATHIINILFILFNMNWRPSNIHSLHTYGVR